MRLDLFASELSATNFGRDAWIWKHDLKAALQYAAECSASDFGRMIILDRRTFVRLGFE
jgi:hypothetical protein